VRGDAAPDECVRGYVGDAIGNGGGYFRMHSAEYDKKSRTGDAVE